MNNIIIKPLLGVEFNDKLLNFGISKNELINFFKRKPDLDEGNHVRYLEYGAFDFNNDTLSNIEIYIDNIGNTNIVSLDDLNLGLPQLSVSFSE